MLKIQVKYFLSKAGIDYFPTWFDEVYSATEKQEGFISLHTDFDKDNPRVCLCFQNIEKLNQWKNQSLHEELVNKLAVYYIESKQVIVEEI